MGEGSEARATHGVGLAGLARLAVGRRGASRGRLLHACAELQGPGVRRGERRARALAGRGSRAVRALAERRGGMGRALKQPGKRGRGGGGLGCWAAGKEKGWKAGLGLDKSFLFFFSSSISISKSNQTI